jgi:hypothetical protein
MRHSRRGGPRTAGPLVTSTVLIMSLIVMSCATPSPNGAGVADDSASTPSADGADRDDWRTLTVPGDHPTIQAAVDAAEPGDLILISPGTYRESVWIATERVVIRGVDRNTVVLDGGYELGDGILVTANGVAIENLTVQRYRQNGILFSGAFAGAASGGGYERTYGIGDDVLDGYRVSYVTAANNGLYGLYAFAARNGVFEHSYASGHPDSGFYVGQCRPCNAVLRDLVAERNAIGYYGTNASGDVWVVESVFRRNRLGIAPNSQDAERLAPQEDTWVVGNLVIDNDDPDTPEIPMGFFGGGIAVGGGTSNMILRNRVEGHDGAGIMVVPLGAFDPLGNTIQDNVLADNRFDLVLRLLEGRPGTNCFAGNVFRTSDPDRIEVSLPCGAGGTFWVDGPWVPLVAPPGRDVRDMPLPPSQPSMPDAATTPPRPAVGVPTFPDPDDLAVPDRR